MSQHPKGGEEGQWNVCSNDDGTGVVMSFVHLGIEGVEQFTTAMNPENAISFGEGVIRIAKELQWYADT